ncbi:hypothetical protein F5Y06DRAFT_295983 [Hypoxylon sp. FL0890]|nr:hypothetical protein F5Y06DRAFT_295983 [Hypoxylon sp. FL0890]
MSHFLHSKKRWHLSARDRGIHTERASQCCRLYSILGVRWPDPERRDQREPHGDDGDTTATAVWFSIATIPFSTLSTPVTVDIESPSGPLHAPIKSTLRDEESPSSCVATDLSSIQASDLVSQDQKTPAKEMSPWKDVMLEYDSEAYSQLVRFGSRMTGCGGEETASILASLTANLAGCLLPCRFILIGPERLSELLPIEYETCWRSSATVKDSEATLLDAFPSSRSVTLRGSSEEDGSGSPQSQCGCQPLTGVVSPRNLSDMATSGT